jgi:putative hydrolase of the HAD superfamily
VLPIRLITVDLDDTLWPGLPTIMAAEQVLYDWLESNAGRLTQAHDIESLQRERLELKRQRPDIAHDLTALRLVSLRRLLSRFGYPEALADQGMALFLKHRNRVAPYADAAPVLKALGARYRLVSVTNGNADVEQTPLRDHFHRSFRAEEVGAAKPDPALFRAALEWAGVGPEQAVHLGDEPFLDVDAARRLGMQAVWINRAGAGWPRELESPQTEVRDLQAFYHWLEALQ